MRASINPAIIPTSRHQILIQIVALLIKIVPLQLSVIMLSLRRDRHLATTLQGAYADSDLDRPFEIPAEGVGKLHLPGRPALRFEDGRRCDQHADAFGARGGHVEPVQAVKKLHASRRVGIARAAALVARDRRRSCEANCWDGASHVLFGVTCFGQNGRELPSPFGQYCVAALRGEKLLDDQAERGIRTWTSPVEIARLLLMRRVIWPLPREHELWRYRVLGAIIPDLDHVVAAEQENLPTPAKPILPLHLRPALLAGVAIVECAGPEMLRMLRGHMMGDNKVRFTDAPRT
ncbi:hypothetical protein [Mesorhizobium sp. BHbdii]